MPTVQVEPLKRLLRAIFEGAGCPAAEAGRIAHYLTRANLAGHDSHGVIRVPRYVEWMRDGVVVADRRAEVVTETPLRRRRRPHGFGQTVAPRRSQVGIEQGARNRASPWWR